MTGRVNPFADLTTPYSSFTVKPKAEKPVAEEAITRIAADNNFPSRQAPKVSREPKRKRRAYTTGRNQQINFKATACYSNRRLMHWNEQGRRSNAISAAISLPWVVRIFAPAHAMKRADQARNRPHTNN